MIEAQQSANGNSKCQNCLYGREVRKSMQICYYALDTGTLRKDKVCNCQKFKARTSGKKSGVSIDNSGINKTIY